MTKLTNDINLIEKLIQAGIEEKEAKKEISILNKEFNDQEKIKDIVNERIKSRKPLQYLLGKAYFMDFEVKVNEKVLIPRPETEILVEETVKRCRGILQHISVLDIGTGSGIIAIALAKLIPDIKVIAIDIEEEILELAKENAKLNNVEEKIKFTTCDIFSQSADKLFAQNKFDLIISNPPYISETVKQRNGGTTIQREVLHEPEVALFGSKENKTGLIYYERILELVTDHKLLALEIDPSLVEDLRQLLKQKKLTGFEFIKDYSKQDRCLFVNL